MFAKRVVITGIGTINPIGDNIEDFSLIWIAGLVAPDILPVLIPLFSKQSLRVRSAIILPNASDWI